MKKKLESARNLRGIPADKILARSLISIIKPALLSEQFNLLLQMTRYFWRLSALLPWTSPRTFPAHSSRNINFSHCEWTARTPRRCCRSHCRRFVTISAFIAIQSSAGKCARGLAKSSFAAFHSKRRINLWEWRNEKLAILFIFSFCRVSIK